MLGCGLSTGPQSLSCLFDLPLGICRANGIHNLCKGPELRSSPAAKEVCGGRGDNELKRCV